MKFKVGDRVRVNDNSAGAVEINGLVGWVKAVSLECENLQLYRVALASGLNITILEENLEAVKRADPVELDMVQKPPHYNKFTFQPIDIIAEVTNYYEGSTAFHIGTVLKYLCRAPFKGKLLEDLKKANYYLTRAIEEMEEGR